MSAVLALTRSWCRKIINSNFVKTNSNPGRKSLNILCCIWFVSEGFCQQDSVVSCVFGSWMSFVFALRASLCSNLRVPLILSLEIQQDWFSQLQHWECANALSMVCFSFQLRDWTTWFFMFSCLDFGCFRWCGFVSLHFNPHPLKTYSGQGSTTCNTLALLFVCTARIDQQRPHCGSFQPKRWS